VNLANNDTLGNNIVNNGNIDAISSNINTLGGVISGTGNLLQNGSGLTILSGNSTYTGETVVFSGTLQVGNGVSGSINSLSQVLVDSGATLALDLAGNPAYFDNSILNDGWVQMIQSNTTYLRGTIYQSGSLSQDGTGLTILTGTNIYTGATNVNNGILRIGNGLTGSINGSSLVTVTSPGILQINMGQNGSIYNQIIDNGLIQWIQSDTNWQDAVSVISGTGSMLISGSGYTLLYGNNTFSGGTTIDNGSGSVGLANSNALGSGTVTINSGYTYSISPSVPLTINVGGYVQTGGEVQYLVTGNHSSTNFQVAGPVSITGGDVSLHNYVGSYTPSGAWTGNPTGDQQTLIHSTVSVTGAYADAFPYAYIKNNAFNTTFDYHHGITLLYPELAYDANNVYANWIQASFSSIPGLTPNQSAVASSLNYYQDHNGPSPDGLITYLDGQNVKKMPGLYDLIAPDELTAIFQIGFSGADVQNANIERHLEQVRAGATGYTSTGFSATSKDGKAVVVDGKNVVVDKNPVTPESKRWSFFLEGSGEFSSVGSTSNAGGYDFTTAGVTLGADYRVNENFAIGILGGYANSNGSLVNQGSLDLNSGKGGVYATVFGNGFYADALVGAGYNSYTTTRSSILGNANGSPDGWELDTLINGGYDFHHGDWSFGPIASVAYTQVNLNNFTESGSLAALKYPSQSQDSLRTNLGAKIVYTATIGGIKVTPQLRVSWQHGFLDNTQSIDSQFASGSSSMFTVSGPQMGRDSAMVSAGVNVQVTPTISVYTYYDGQLGRSNYSSNNVTGGVKVDF
jgi:outer membrane autotransporter protein